MRQQIDLVFATLLVRAEDQETRKDHGMQVLPRKVTTRPMPREEEVRSGIPDVPLANCLPTFPRSRDSEIVTGVSLDLLLNSLMHNLVTNHGTKYNEGYLGSGIQVGIGAAESPCGSDKNDFSCFLIGARNGHNDHNSPHRVSFQRI